MSVQYINISYQTAIFIKHQRPAVTFIAIWPNYNISPTADCSEIRGPISLPKRYLLGEIGRVRSR